jgi:hypothetical protein
MRTLEIDGISDAIIAADFSFVEFDFTTERRPVRARLKVAAVDSIAQRLSEMLNYIRSNTFKRGEKFTVQASPVLDAIASPAAGGVVLELKGSNGVWSYFNLSVEQSAKFRALMLAAEQANPPAAMASAAGEG